MLQPARPNKYNNQIENVIKSRKEGNLGKLKFLYPCISFPWEKFT